MDRSEFERLYDREFARLTGQLTVLCGDPEEAADCVQEAFVRAWERRAEVTASRSPGGWVHTTAVRIATSRWRKARNAVTAWTRLGGRRTATAVAPDDVDDTTVAALRQLPADQRHALALHYVCDMPVAEIADLLGASPGAVRVRLHRGRQALGALLTQPATGASPSLRAAEGA